MVPVLPTPTVPVSNGVPTKSKLLTSGVHCPAGRFPIKPKILAILTVFEASWRAREFETSPTVPCADRVTDTRLVPLPPSSTEVHEVVTVLCCTRMSCPDATDASIWPKLDCRCVYVDGARSGQHHTYSRRQGNGDCGRTPPRIRTEFCKHKRYHVVRPGNGVRTCMNEDATSERGWIRHCYGRLGPRRGGGWGRPRTLDSG